MNRPEPGGIEGITAPVDQEGGQEGEKAVDEEEEEDDLFNENVKLEE